MPLWLPLTWSDDRWLDRRAAAVDEHADSSGLGRAADMDFDGRRKLEASTSSNTFGMCIMLDGVLLIVARYWRRKEE